MEQVKGALRTRAAGIWVSGVVLAAAALALVYASVTPHGSTLPDGSKATPFSLTVFSSASLPAEVQQQEAASAPLLFDRDTTTQHVAFAESSVQATFESAQEVRAIKVFGAAPYFLTVKADAGGSFQTIPGLENQNLATLPQAWNTLRALGPVTTTKLLFVLTPASGSAATGLAELEVWTTATSISAKSGAQLLERVLGPTPPAQARVYTALNSTATPTEALVVPGDNNTGQAHLPRRARAHHLGEGVRGRRRRARHGLDLLCLRSAQADRAGGRRQVQHHQRRLRQPRPAHCYRQPGCGQDRDPLRPRVQRHREDHGEPAGAVAEHRP